MAQRPAISSSLVLAFLLGFAAVAGAQDTEAGGRRAAALHWVRLPGAEDCSGGDALSRAVEAKLRREVFPAPRNASVLVEGYVERTSGGYRAALQMRTSDGELLGSRELSSKARDCDELSETIAVVLAVMIDPEGAAQGDASPRPEPPAETTRAFARRPHVMHGFARVALGVYKAGASEEASLVGGGLAYEHGLGKWGALRAEVAGLTSRHTILLADNTRAGPTRITLGYAGLGYCPLWLTAGRLRSSVCASGEVGGFRAAESPDRSDEPGPAEWVSGSLQARFALRLFGPIEAQAGGSLSVTIVPPELQTARYTITTRGVLGSVELGLGVRF